MKKQLVTALLLATACNVNAETVNIPVPKAVVVGAFNTALSGVKVHVDNYGSKQGTSWLSQQSYILLPDGSKKKFNIPEQTTDVTKRRKWRHYINDFNSKEIQVAANGSQLEMTVHFESQGEEIKGKCIKTKLSGKKKECTLNMERDIHLNNSSIEVSLKPAAYNGSIAFSNVGAKFKTDLHIPNKLCQLFSGLCGKIESFIKSKIKNAIESNIKTQLNKSAVKKAVADKVKNALKGTIDPEWKVIDVASSGSNYVIKVQRPDTIDKNTVSINQFKAVKNVETMSCPGNVSFNASITAKTKVAGTVWLEHENGKKSKVINWNMPKKGSNTSTLTREWDQKDFKQHNGWSRMVLKWKGTDGKYVTKKSSKATFKRSCQKASGVVQGFKAPGAPAKPMRIQGLKTQ